MEYKITEGEADIAFGLFLAIPEFDQPIRRDAFNARLALQDCLVLVIYLDGLPSGFKIGYAREGKYYSWLGGVLPEFRKLGLAKALADCMEGKARGLGFGTIWMKTRNRFREMLCFAIRNGFCITGIKHAEGSDDHRIILEKKL